MQRENAKTLACIKLVKKRKEGILRSMQIGR